MMRTAISPRLAIRTFVNTGSGLKQDERLAELDRLAVADQHVRHHEDVAAFAAWAEASGLPVIAIDNVEGSRPLPEADLPQTCVLLFGQVGPGLSAEALAAASVSVEIAQYGSTRSINAAAAAAVVMYEWCRRWA